jgi:hypothetical protein
MVQPRPIHTPDRLYVDGKRLQVSLYERVNALKTLYESVLKDLTDQLRSAVGGLDDPFPKIAALVVVLAAQAEDMSVHAITVQAKAVKAAKLQQEIAELSRMAKHVDAEAAFALTWDEAKRYGL